MQFEFFRFQALSYKADEVENAIDPLPSLVLQVLLISPHSTRAAMFGFDNSSRIPVHTVAGWLLLGRGSALECQELELDDLQRPCVFFLLHFIFSFSSSEQPCQPVLGVLDLGKRKGSGSLKASPTERGQ